jgi:hypothetical protein
LYGIQIAREDEFCGRILDAQPVKMTLIDAHGKLGHMSFQKTKQVANQLGWILTGSSKVCKACAEGKAQQKNIIDKAKKGLDSVQNGRIHLDISSVKNHDYEDSTSKPYWDGQVPKYLKYLRTWREAGTVKLKSRSHTKLDDCGHTCMFVGYSTAHAGNTYCMWDPRSRRVHITRDIWWLNKMFLIKVTTYVSPILEELVEILKMKIQMRKVSIQLMIRMITMIATKA